MILASTFIYGADEIGIPVCLPVSASFLLVNVAAHQIRNEATHKLLTSV